MKILVVTPDYPPNCGGGGIVVKYVSEELVRRGHQVSVMSGYLDRNDEHNDIYKEEINGVHISWIPLMKVPLLEKIPQLIYSLPPKFQTLSYLRNVDYDQYDIIHLFAIPTHPIVDLVCILSTNKNMVSTIHAFPMYVDKNGPANIIFKFIYTLYLNTIFRYTVRRSKMVTVVSRSTANDAIKRLVPKEKIIIIPNGIEIEKNLDNRKNDSIINDKFNLNNDTKLFLTIGRIVWHKGYEYSISSIRNIIDMSNNKIDIKYIIFGDIIDINYFYKLRELVSNLRLDDIVIFAGYVDEKIKLDGIRRADIYIAPSLSEGFGLSLLESMMLGKVIIATKIKGHQDIVEHKKTALLVQSGSADDISSALNTLLNDDILANLLSENAEKAAKYYDWKNIVEKYERIYLENGL